MKVCWLSEVASPYKMKLASLLAEKVELTVFLLESVSVKRPDSWLSSDCGKARLVILNATNFWKEGLKAARENDLLIDSAYSTFVGIVLTRLFKRQHKTCVLHADGGIAVNRGKLVNGAVSFLMKQHDYFFSSGEVTDRYFLFYGVVESKIRHYRFSSLSKRDIAENREMSAQKLFWRKKLKIDSEYMFLSVGRPLPLKGFDTLVEAFRRADFQKDCELWIVGGEAEEKVKRMVEEGKMTNVHFVRAVSSEKLKEYYAAADCFVFASRYDIWGLVVQEALSFGLPVIVADGCVAGEHFSRLSERVHLLPCGDVAAFAAEMKQ